MTSRDVKENLLTAVREAIDSMALAAERLRNGWDADDVAGALIGDVRSIRGDFATRCTECNGEGIIYVWDAAMMETQTPRCGACGGEGWFW